MGAVNTTYTFTATDTITSTKMNNIIDQTTMTGDAISGSTLEVTSSGKLKVRALGITSNEIANGQVISAKIADNTIPVSKLENPSFSWYADANGTAIELGPNIASDSFAVFDFHSTSGSDYNARIIRNPGTNGNFEITNTGTSPIILSASGGVTFGTSNMPTPSGSAPIFGVRAWANFNAQSNNDLAGSYSRSGTAVTITATAHGLIAGNLIFIDFTVNTGTAPFDGLYVVDSVTDANTFTVTSSASTASTGTAILKRKTIRGSGNISCISAAAPSPIIPPTSNDTVANGYYIANFSVSMPNSNFAVFGTCSEDGALSAGSGNDILAGSPYNEKSAFITTISIAGGAIDALHNSVSIIG